MSDFGGFGDSGGGHFFGDSGASHHAGDFGASHHAGDFGSHHHTVPHHDVAVAPYGYWGSSTSDVTHAASPAKPRGGRNAFVTVAALGVGSLLALDGYIRLHPKDAPANEKDSNASWVAKLEMLGGAALIGFGLLR